MPDAPKSWKAEMHVQGSWSSNVLRFATEKEANDSGAELMSRWTLPDGYRAVPTDDPVNYKFVDGKSVRIN